MFCMLNLLACLKLAFEHLLGTELFCLNDCYPLLRVSLETMLGGVGRGQIATLHNCI